MIIASQHFTIGPWYGLSTQIAETAAKGGSKRRRQKEEAKGGNKGSTTPRAKRDIDSLPNEILVLLRGIRHSNCH
jgi:hypothetical protein